MSLKDSDIKDSYFLNGEAPYFFYNELYLHATEITIALGYFARSAFCIATEALLHFIKNNNGKIHLFCNDKLLLEDTEAISNGYKLKEQHNITLKDFEDLIKSRDNNKQQVFSYKCLSYLIAIGRLDISVGKSDRLVHFKTGYATDDEGNIVAFTGSVNYTLSALLFNWEQLSTFCSWKSPKDYIAQRIDEIVEPVRLLQNGEIKDLPLVSGKDIEQFIRESYRVENILELEKEASILNSTLKISLHDKKISVVGEKDSPTFFSIPSTFAPRKHQVAAIENFFSNQYKSLFAMATGTGKTLTSLFAVNDLSYNYEILSLLILVPLQDLVLQWEKDVKRFFSGKIVKIGSGFQSWKSDLEDYRVSRLFSKRKPLVIISTYDSFLLKHDEIMKSLTKDKTAIIADEVHAFGSENRKNLMPEEIQYRIGLSATPKRSYDTVGTKAIFDYFCPSQNYFYYSIGDAIAAGYLCKYRYYPIPVELTPDEDDEYASFSDSISRLASRWKSLTKEEQEQLTLLSKLRHRIIENAANKEEAFERCISSILLHEKLSHTIIFCPEGKNDDDDSYIDIVNKTLFKISKQLKQTIRIQKYVGGSGSQILDNFANGYIDVLLAKKRLNEGIDIPSTSRAIFISSSTSEREFIQRRGRVLRPYAGKEYADIYDFIVFPSASTQRNASLFSNEMQRVYDFIDTAENKAEALIKINKMVESK